MVMATMVITAITAAKSQGKTSAPTFSGSSLMMKARIFVRLTNIPYLYN